METPPSDSRRSGGLPRLSETREIEVGAVYRPVGREIEVGGDFYDLVPVSGGEEGAWIALVGDVCGKGNVAAATSDRLQHEIRAVAVRERSPARILSALNDSMLRETLAHSFCTAACALIEPAGDGLDLTLARAGHPPPVLLRGDSTWKLDSPGKALGIFPEPDLEERTARLEAGEPIILYTDGVTEARSPEGEFFGEERLLSLLTSCSGLGASAVSERVLEAVMDHSRQAPGDDIAVLVLRAPETEGTEARSGEHRPS